MRKFNRSYWCGSPEHGWNPNRREFLFVGLLGTLGLSMGELFRLQAAAPAGQLSNGKGAPAKSIINIYLPGGMAAQETFDPKMLAPLEYRGPFSTIKTKLPGVHFSEMMKNTAGVADKITVVRSMTHGEADHDRGTHNMFTGYRPSPALMYPSFGSVISHELGTRNDLPPYVCVPSMPSTFAGTGYLGSAFGPFSIGGDPASKDFKVRDLTLPKGIDDQHFAERRDMRSAVDEHFSALEKSDALEGMDTFYQRAYALISSPKAREAFSLKDEPEKLRQEYGANAAGMRMLLARRLVEAGVRCVSLSYGGWDHHDNIKTAITSQMPNFDQAFAALIRDLDQRGLLDSTLVMVTTEFGRTPKINATAGRDHYPKVFSVVLAGGGIKRGQVYGSSDATGGEPDESPLTVPDLANTVYTQLGIDPEKNLMSPGNRPVKIVKDGNLVKELLA
ncbi:MAG: hypothetical protein JWM16_5591 [Verrucomicrobiales bacterium]|nr:hypothetical protein [Verrucomicrobiales bacterium]